MRSIVGGGIEEGVLMDVGIVWEAIEERCTCCYRSGKWAIIKFLEFFKGSAPRICRIEERWVDGERLHG